MPPEKSVFTKIIDRELPATFLYEDEQCIIIENIAPWSEIHWLAITKKPFQCIHELLENEENKNLLWHLLKTLDTVACQHGLDVKGYRIVTNNGEGAGQSVPHLHVHLLSGNKLLEHDGL